MIVPDDSYAIHTILNSEHNRKTYNYRLLSLCRSTSTRYRNVTRYVIFMFAQTNNRAL